MCRDRRDEGVLRYVRSRGRFRSPASPFSRAHAVITSIAAGRNEGVISCHSVAEVFSALTSLPLVPRILPAEAEQIIRVNVRPHFKLIPVTSAMYERAVDICVRQSLSGGKVYDGLLVECARKGRCERIYTFNVADFQRLAPDLIPIIAAP